MSFAEKLKSLRLPCKRGFWLILIPGLLIVLFCTIQLFRPCKQYRYENSHTFAEGSPAREFISDPIALKPGVYYIEQEYVCDTDRNGHINATDGTVFTGGLLTNGEHTYPALSKTGYHLWLYESTRNLQFTAEYTGEGSLTTGGITITRTNKLWSMLLTVILFTELLLLGIYGFYHYDKAYPVDIRKKNVFFGLFLICLIASSPQLLNCCFSGGDMTYHLLRIEGVKDGLISGQFPVRIEPEWLFDHGYANAIFYCNGLFLFPAILRLLGFNITVVYNLYCIALNIATACISYYCFGRMFKSPKIGMAASALYTLSVIRIFKLVMVGAIGEGSAITFIPLVLYGLYCIFTKDTEESCFKTAWVPLAIGYAGLIQTHVLTCEITAFVTILICLFYVRKVFCRKHFLNLVKAALAAAGMSLWYLVPFLDYYLTEDVHIKHVSARTIQAEGLTFGQLLHHFWKIGDASVADTLYDTPTGIGLLLAVGLLAFPGLWISQRFEKEKLTGFVKLSALLGTLLLIMSLKVFPWDKIQFIHPIAASLVSSLQFPNRFLGWACALLITVYGYLLSYTERKGCKQASFALYVLVLVSITTGSMFLLDHVNANYGRYTIYHEEGMGFGYISGGEYIIEGTDVGRLSFENPVCQENTELVSYNKEYLHIEARCINTSQKESYVDMPLMLYKGYVAYDTATKERLDICYGDNYKLRVLIPAGYSGTFELYFKSPLYWRISEGISLFTYGFMVLLGVRQLRTNNKRRKALYENI